MALRTQRTPITPAFSPLLGEYDSRDRAILSQHVDWARENRINTFMIEWCGRELSQFTDSHDDIVSGFLTNPSFNRIRFFFVYSLVSATRREGEAPFRAIDIDNPLLHDKIIGDLRYAASRYFTRPNYLRLRQRLALLLYAANLLGGDLPRFIAELRTTVRTETSLEPYLIADQVGWNSSPDPDLTPLFDAVMPYAAIDHRLESGRETALGVVSEELLDLYACWLNAAHDLGVDFITSVYPGFNGAGAPWCLDDDSQSLVPVIRRDHDDFRSLIRGALSMADPEIRMIGITSFNEWNEGTNIEPSLEFGYSSLYAVRQALTHRPVNAPPRSILRFSYHSLFDSPGEDDRQLGADFDFVEFLDAPGAVLLSIDIGSVSALRHLGSGWYSSESGWDGVEDCAWGGTQLAASTLHVTLTHGVRAIRVRSLFNDHQPVGLSLNGHMIGALQSTAPRSWVTHTLEIPTAAIMRAAVN